MLAIFEWCLWAIGYFAGAVVLIWIICALADVVIDRQDID